MDKKMKSIPVTKNQANAVAESVREHLNLDDNVQVAVIQKRKQAPIPNFTFLFQAVGYFAMNEITPSSLKLLWYFLTKMQYSNHIGINQKTMAEETGMPMTTIKVSIRQLKEKKVLLSYDDMIDNRRNVYIINPNIAWRGTASERGKAIKKLMAVDPNQLNMFGKLFESINERGLPIEKK